MQKNLTKNNNIFSRQDTKIIKGFAIFMMLIHHLWGFPERYLPDMQFKMSNIMVPGTEQDLFVAIGGFGKICVTLFMFLGGYGLWYKTRKEYSLAKDIMRLYQALWKVAIIFIPIGLLFFAHQSEYMGDIILSHVFDDHSVGTIIHNFLGTSNNYSPEGWYNPEWWFFMPYLIAVIIGYIFISMSKINNFWIDAFCVLLFDIATKDFFPAIVAIEPLSRLWQSFWFQKFFTCREFTSCFLMGIVFAKYNALVHLQELYRETFLTKFGKLVGGGIGIIIIFWCRQYLLCELDILYMPFVIIFILEWIKAFSPLQKFFALLGKHSTNMWLTHSFYCYYFGSVVKLVLMSRNAYIALATLIVLSLITAIALDKFWGFIGFCRQRAFGRES